MITYEVNKADLAFVQKKLQGLGRKGPRVIAKAINYTAIDAVRQLAHGAQSTYTVKVKGFQEAMDIQKATPGNLVAIIKSTDSPIRLTGYTHRGGSKKKGGKGASAQVLVAGSLKEIVNGSGTKAFKKKGQILQRQTQESYPLRVMYSNSIPKMIEKVYKGERGANRAIKQTINDKLHLHISQEVAKLV